MNNVATLPCETQRSRCVSEQQLELRTKKHTKSFCHIVYKTRPVRIKFCIYCVEYICYRLLQVFSTSPKYCVYTTLWNLKVVFLWKL